MCAKLSSQALLDRWEDRRACQNLVGKFSQSHLTREEGLSYQRFWSARSDVCLGLNNGYYHGAAAVQGYYRALWEKNVLCSKLLKAYFPEELGQYSDEECLGVGLVGYKSTDTGVVEVADDGETAKGLWVLRGGYLDLTVSGMTFNTIWGYLAVDFIKEDGAWRFWHMRELYDVDCPNGQGWSEPVPEYPPDPKLAKLQAFQLPAPNVPCVLREYYSADRDFTPSPVPPRPYGTFSETFSYGIEQEGA